MQDQAEGHEKQASELLSWGTKALMLTGGLSVALAMGAIIPVLPQIDAALAHTPNEHLLTKLTLTIVGATMVIGAPLAGFLTDYVGKRKVLFISSLVFAIAGTAGLYLDTLMALIVSRLCVGITAAAIATTSMTLINSNFEGNARAKWMGAHVSVAAVGGLLLQPVSGLLGEIGWRGPFALYGLGLIFAVIAFLNISETKSTARLGSSDRPTQPVWRWFPARYALLAFCIGSITYIPNVYVSFLLRQAGVASPFLISLVLLADTTLAAIMSMLFGRLRPISSQAAFAFSFTCTGTGMALAAFTPGVVGIVAGVILFGVGLGWFVPNLMTAAAKQVTQEQQGRTVGLVKAAHYAAAPICTILVEPLARRFGPNGPIAAGAALSFCLLLIFAYHIAIRQTNGAHAELRA